MDIGYKTNKMRKACEDPKIAQKEYGSQIGAKLTQRVGELKAADNLSIISAMPAPELHKLDGKRKNEYAVKLVHPYRLVFTPCLDDGVSIDDLSNIRIVRIEEVVDYHGKEKR